VQHAEHIATTSPWRAATVVVGLVAAVELVALVAVGVVHLAPSRHAPPSRPPAAQATASVTHVAPPPSQPLRPRAHVRVLVLNGNGVSGAAAGAAQHLELEGYRIGATTNAPRHDYAQSMVMYVPGWAKEARRLAHDADVRLVAPIDGLVPAQLKGSKIVLLLGT
jgi:LytR cell envelope-related transcriptional attenuator